MRVLPAGYRLDTGLGTQLQTALLFPANVWPVSKALTPTMMLGLAWSPARGLLSFSSDFWPSAGRRDVGRATND